MIPILRRLASIVTLLVVVTACGSDRNNGRIHASGHIEATEVRLAAKVGGRLVEAPFEEGDRVSQGEVVARLETIDAELRLAEARAVVDSADAQLRLLLAGSRAEDLRRAEDQLAQARAELDAAARDFDRLDGLAQRGSATAKARDDAATRREIAERAVAAARAQLDKLVSGPRSQEIEAARAQRAAAEARVDAVRQQITDATVLAPRVGVLVERVAEPGEILHPGAVIAILVDLARPWLDVWVGEPSLARIHLGDPVEVRVDGHEQSLNGTVGYISDVAEFTPKNVQTPDERAKLVFRVKITLDNREGLFKPGMPADAWFGGGDAEETE
jgi:HlyD family secretion protein